MTQLMMKQTATLQPGASWGYDVNITPADCVELAQYCGSKFCPSVCHSHMRALWRIERTHCRYFDTTWKGNHSSFIVPTEGAGRCPLPPEICTQSDPPHFEKRRLRPLSAYSDWTVRASEKCSIIANRKSTTRFPTSYICEVRRLPVLIQRVTQKANLSCLWIKFKFHRTKSTTQFLCVKTSSSNVVVEPLLYLTVYTWDAMT